MIVLDAKTKFTKNFEDGVDAFWRLESKYDDIIEWWGKDKTCNCEVIEECKHFDRIIFDKLAEQTRESRINLDVLLEERRSLPTSYLQGENNEK